MDIELVNILYYTIIMYGVWLIINQSNNFILK